VKNRNLVDENQPARIQFSPLDAILENLKEANIPAAETLFDHPGCDNARTPELLVRLSESQIHHTILSCGKNDRQSLFDIHGETPCLSLPFHLLHAAARSETSDLDIYYTPPDSVSVLKSSKNSKIAPLATDVKHLLPNTHAPRAC